jgi:ribosomal protein S21
MLHVFVDDNYNLDVEIRIFARNMKREVIGVIDSFHSC